ncbi:MAG: DUF2953 domain-containing protein [Trueperaceae bacterium]|nr:MAG: DUF2953 domain-containing protein [Trueperaceae bacterium]
MSVVLTLIWVVSVLTIALLVLLALVLVSTFRVDGHLDGNLDDPSGRLRLRWTLLAVVLDVRERTLELRLVRWRLIRRTFAEMRTDPDTTPTPREPRGPHPRRAGGAGIGGLHFYLRQLRYVIARIRLDRFDLDLRVATPDPAVTGALYGATCGVVYPLLACWPHARLAVRPDFVGSVPAGSVALALRVRLATLALVAWRVFWYQRSKAGKALTPSTGNGRRSHGTT